MTITGGSALPKDDIDRMMRDAEAHAEEDKARREEAEVRNQAEALVYQTEKFIKDNDEKLPGGRQGARSTPRSPRPTRRSRAPTSQASSPRSRSWPTSRSSSARRCTRRHQAARPTPAGAAGGAGAPVPRRRAEDIVDAEIVDEDEKK